MYAVLEKLINIKEELEQEMCKDIWPVKCAKFDAIRKIDKLIKEITDGDLSI